MRGIRDIAGQVFRRISFLFLGNSQSGPPSTTMLNDPSTRKRLLEVFNRFVNARGKKMHEILDSSEGVLLLDPAVQYMLREAAQKARAAGEEAIAGSIESYSRILTSHKAFLEYHAELLKLSERYRDRSVFFDGIWPSECARLRGKFSYTAPEDGDSDTD